MAGTAIFLSLIALAVTGAWIHILRRRLAAIIRRIEEIAPSRTFPVAPEAARFVPQEVVSSPVFIPELDVAGAWASEMEAAGIRVTPAELALQRRMRLEAGL